jgi:hypothetical protein
MSILAEICDRKRAHVAQKKAEMPLEDVMRAAAAMPSPADLFIACAAIRARQSSPKLKKPRRAAALSATISMRRRLLAPISRPGRAASRS